MDENPTYINSQVSISTNVVSASGYRGIGLHMVYTLWDARAEGQPSSQAIASRECFQKGEND